jgi:hypothetical protein
MSDLQRKLLRRRRRISMHKFRTRSSSSDSDAWADGKENAADADTSAMDLSARAL